MTAIGPYTQSLNMTHMFSFVDYRGPSEIVTCSSGNSIMDYIDKHPKLTKFKKIIKAANFTTQLSQKQANFTLFAPLDEHIGNVDNIGDGLARQILSMSLMDKEIDGNLLRSSPVSYIATKNSQNRMYITNICGVTELNQLAQVVQYDIKTDNGIIHLTNGLLFPTNNTFIN